VISCADDHKKYPLCTNVLILYIRDILRES
jgi:hypothetical protein